MLGLVGFSRRISLIGMVLTVLTPFICRPLLSLCMHGQGFWAGVSYTNNSGSRHLARTLIRQLDSQAQETDSKHQKPQLAVSSNIHPLRRGVGVDNKENLLFFTNRLAAFSPGHTVPLRI
jgi:hypothetical protein